ncbi:MAG: hypothetical protein JKY53_14050 [Flavobacteriales bacterium]|nr:hypothetical protein [Flavobacteriales bacterium]
MKKHFLTVLFIGALLFTSFAQEEPETNVGSDFTKLKEMFEKEKYEDCAYKAETMTMKDKYRSSAEPYLFLAMCNWKIHEIGGEQLEEEYPKAYSDAFKYAGKLRKKDKKKKLYEEYKEFFDELKDAGVRDAIDFYLSNNYRKAASTLKKVYKIAPESIAIKFSKGVCDIMANNLSEGGLWIKESAVVLQQFAKDGNYEKDPATDEMLADAFVTYSDYLLGKAEADSARHTIVLGQALLGDHYKIEAQYKKLIN